MLQKKENVRWAYDQGFALILSNLNLCINSEQVTFASLFPVVFLSNQSSTCGRKCLRLTENMDVYQSALQTKIWCWDTKEPFPSSLGKSKNWYLQLPVFWASRCHWSNYWDWASFKLFANLATNWIWDFRGLILVDFFFLILVYLSLFPLLVTNSLSQNCLLTLSVSPLYNNFM